MSRTPLVPDPTGCEADDSFFAAATALHHEDGTAHVHLTGDLCPTSAPILANVLDTLVSDGVGTIVVDVSALRLCTSHGLDVLDDARSRVTQAGGRLSIENASGVVRKVLEITGIAP